MAEQFPPARSQLERYALRLPAVEINTSFYRPHRTATYVRWAASVPTAFRFSVKVPKAITHDRRLEGADEALATFLAEANWLESRLGCLLVQLPPSLNFDIAVADRFFDMLRKQTSLAVACEPRHATWFQPEAESLLTQYEVARVATDPAPVPDAASPGGWREFTYYRLHGSPRMYYSPYSEAYLDGLAAKLRKDTLKAPSWCIFDNTAHGAATANAIELLSRLAAPPP